MDASWMDVLIQVVEILLGLVVSVGIPWLISTIKSKTNNSKVQEMLERAEKYATSAVLMVTQTFVEQMKRDGKFDADAQAEAFNRAKDAWLAMMSDEMKKVVLEEVGNFEVYIKTLIEAEVNKQK